MYQLQAIFLYNDEVWGTLDEETGKWNGVIGMVGYQHVQYHMKIYCWNYILQVGYGGADIGVCGIGYTYERSYKLGLGTVNLTFYYKKSTFQVDLNLLSHFNTQLLDKTKMRN